MENLKDELLLLWGKIWIWAALITLGLIGKLSYDIKMKKKFTFITFLSTLGIAVFIGYLASAFCIYKGWERQGMLIVPVSTLLSEKGIEILIANAHKWFSAFYKKPKDDDESK